MGLFKKGMSYMSRVITLAHGSGGKLTHELISNIFYKHFENEILSQGNDSAVFEVNGRLACSTDSFVITPIFFNGGNIGKLAVCGTVNDLAAMGAVPKFLTCGFIIEEGLPFEDLEKIVSSMAETAKEAGVKIITGDTKVVEKGACDKIFVNTTGIGFIPNDRNTGGELAEVGDVIIITGTIGDHGASILLSREDLGIEADIKSDCAPMQGVVESIFSASSNIHVLRDPTRGGVATTLNEIAHQSKVGIKLFEEALPIKPEVQGVCDMLGLDPLYMANEGKMLVIVPKNHASEVINAIRECDIGKNASIIGEVVPENVGKVVMKTISGGTRIVDMLTGEQLPRIC